MAEVELDDFRFVPAWRLDNPVIKRDATGFWNDLNVSLARDTPETRANQLVLIAYDRDKVAGLGTAEVIRLTGTRHDFAACRVLVAPAYRRMSLGRNITGRSFDLIEDRARKHPEEGVAGVASIWESRAEFFDGKVTPIWDYGSFMDPPQERAPLVLWAYRPDGEEIYFRWFEHISI